MTLRQKIRIRRVVQAVESYQEQLQIGLIVGGSNGQFRLVVNARDVPRDAVAETDLANCVAQHSVGDEVFVLTANANDMPRIVGRSNWILHGETMIG